MEQLSNNYGEFAHFPEKVIQFGEGNFMRGFVDWQLQQMNKQGLFNGSAVVVQPISQGLGKMLKEQDYLYTKTWKSSFPIRRKPALLMMKVTL